LIYNDIFFIDGREKNDPEIMELKSKLVEVAFKQKSWGKPMSIAWVRLELQMSELRFHNMNIISKEELMTLNITFVFPHPYQPRKKIPRQTSCFYHINKIFVYLLINSICYEDYIHCAV
jgi:hypothetical protein